MGISGARRAKIYDDATDEYVDILHIAPDSDYNKDGVGEDDIDGMPVWVEDQAELVLGFYDDDDVAAKLKQWQKDRTPLNIVVIGVDDYIFWNEPSTIIVREPNDFRPRNRNKRQLVTRARGEDLTIEREKGYVVEDSEGLEMEGFVGRDDNGDGIAAVNLPPASYGTEDTFTWPIDGTDYVMETVMMNTAN